MKRLFHGTSEESGNALLADPRLDVQEIAQRSNGALPGFYLATRKLPAAYLGLLHRDDLIVLRYELHADAFNGLVDCGSELRPVPQLGSAIPLVGQEFFVPPHCFDAFNEYLDDGMIVVVPTTEPPAPT